MNKGTIGKIKYDTGQKPKIQIRLDLQYETECDKTKHNIFIIGDPPHPVLIEADKWFETDFQIDVAALMHKKCGFELAGQAPSYHLTSIIIDAENE